MTISETDIMTAAVTDAFRYLAHGLTVGETAVYMRMLYPDDVAESAARLAGAVVDYRAVAA